MAKHNYIILFVLAVVTAIFFSGCSIPFSGGSRSSGSGLTGPAITTGIHSSDSSKRGGTDLEPMPKPSKTFSDKEMFSYIAGLKIAYDASSNYADFAENLSTATYSSQLLLDLSEELSTNGYEYFDVSTFLDFHADMELDQTQIFRAIWILNIIDQYQLLSKAILSDVVGNYGFGYLQNTQLSSTFYPSVDLGAGVSPTEENLDIIDFSATATTDNLVFDNPNYIDPANPQYPDSTYYYKDCQTITLDLENAKLKIGENQKDVVDIPSSVVSQFASWEINNLNFLKDYLEYTNSFYFANPFYNQSITDASDIRFHQTLYINASISDFEISYNLSFDAPQEIELDLDDYLDAYLQANSLYFAYKILESVCNVPIEERFYGTPSQIEMFDFLSLIPTYISLGGRLGLVENAFDLEIGDLSVTEKIVGILEDCFFGGEDEKISQSFAGFVDNRLNQYVVVSQDGVVCALPTDTEIQKLFVDSYNIEYVDISLDQLYSQEKDDFLADYGNIISVVLMVNPELENTMYFETICLAFCALNYDVDLITYFRYVQSGVEKIFADFDYADTSAIDEDIQSNFEGNIPVLEGEITMDYIENTILNIVKENVPNSNMFDNNEMLINGFVNHNPSDFLRALNVKNNSVYGYDADKNCYYYSQDSADCDYIELSFVATNPENIISYSFMYVYACLENKTA